MMSITPKFVFKERPLPGSQFIRYDIESNFCTERSVVGLRGGTFTVSTSVVQRTLKGG